MEQMRRRNAFDEETKPRDPADPGANTGLCGFQGKIKPAFAPRTLQMFLDRATETRRQRERERERETEQQRDRETERGRERERERETETDRKRQAQRDTATLAQTPGWNFVALMSQWQMSHPVQLSPVALGRCLELLLTDASSSKSDSSTSRSTSMTSQQSGAAHDKGPWTSSGRPRRQHWLCHCGRGTYWDRITCRRCNQCNAPHTGRPVHNGIPLPAMTAQASQTAPPMRRGKVGTSKHRNNSSSLTSSSNDQQGDTEGKKKQQVTVAVKETMATKASLQVALDALGDSPEHASLKQQLEEDLQKATEKAKDARLGGARWDSAKAALERNAKHSKRQRRTA